MSSPSYNSNNTLAFAFDSLFSFSLNFKLYLNITSFSVQGQCKPSVIEFIRITEAPPELAVATCLRLQGYGDFDTPTIPMMGHSAYHEYGILRKCPIFWINLRLYLPEFRRMGVPSSKPYGYWE